MDLNLPLFRQCWIPQNLSGYPFEISGGLVKGGRGKIYLRGEAQFDLEPIFNLTFILSPCLDFGEVRGFTKVLSGNVGLYV